MLAGICDLPWVTGEVPVVPKLPVTVGSTTTFGVGLILPALYASASSRWMRKTSSEILDVLGGQRAVPVERRIAAVGLLADVAQHPVLDAARDGVLDRVEVKQARGNCGDAKNASRKDVKSRRDWSATWNGQR